MPHTHTHASFSEFRLERPLSVSAVIFSALTRRRSNLPLMYTLLHSTQLQLHYISISEFLKMYNAFTLIPDLIDTYTAAELDGRA